MKLIEKYPDAKKQFIKDRNQGISIDEIGIGSRKKIWWKCENGDDHFWLASPNQRTSGGTLRGCPVCAGKLIVSSNSLETNYPEISKEWNYEKNGDLAYDLAVTYTLENKTRLKYMGIQMKKAEPFLTFL